MFRLQIKKHDRVKLISYAYIYMQSQKYFILLFFSILTLSFSAHASVAGSWSGSGDWIVENSTTGCSVNLSFDENSSELDRLGGNMDCDVVSMDTGSETLQKVNDQLVLNGEVVGTWKQDYYDWTEVKQDAKIHTIIQVNGKHMDYEEIWTDNKDGSPIYDIKASLNQ